MQRADKRKLITERKIFNTRPIAGESLRKFGVGKSKVNRSVAEEW